jgi:hypothetical protein
MAIDDSRAVAGEPYLQATARAPEARMSPKHRRECGIGTVAMISNDRGTSTLPAVVDPEMVDGVVWLPSRAPGLGIPQHLAASAGDLVTIGPGDELGRLSWGNANEPARRSDGSRVFFNDRWWVVLLKATVRIRGPCWC